MSDWNKQKPKSLTKDGGRIYRNYRRTFDGYLGKYAFAASLYRYIAAATS